MRKNLLLVLTLLLSGCDRPLPVFGEVPDFSFTDQTGGTVRKDDLLGKIWVANFIYSGCGDVCPMLTKKMKGFQEEMGRLSEARDLHLVSFTVDPENDTPQRLAAYAAAFDADPERWFFLTGPLDAVRKTVEEGLRQSMGRTGDSTLFHSERFVLIDRQCRIRGFFETDPSGLKTLVRGLRSLVNEKEESR